MIFDWGGTLTRWHDVDFHAESVALAAAVTTIGHDADAARVALHEAGRNVWGRSRDHQESATVADLFDEAGLDHDPALLTAYREFWEPHTYTDPAVRPMLERLRAAGAQGRRAVEHDLAARVARRVLRARRGLRPASTVTSTPARSRGRSRRRGRSRPRWSAVGVTDPARCVYVGDRLYDDIWGAQQAGMRAVHIPLSDIPAEQVGADEGAPDGVIHTLAELPDLLASW